jgi:predicted RNA-binding Zn-ribbon protein involved in translation (DUF1610 family)
MPRKLTTEEFIKKAQVIHPDVDFSKTNYINSKTSVIITCPIHGDVEVNPARYLNSKYNCPYCGGTKKKTTETFIKECKALYGDEFLYDKVNYVASDIPVIITCKKHGDWTVRPYSFLQGYKCPKCGKESMADKRRLTTEEFIKRSRSIHGDKYNYSKVNYTGYRDRVCIICPEHGEFLQAPEDHMYGRGCPECGKERVIEKNTYSIEKFIEKAKEVHGDKYDYSKVNYIDSYTKVCIICPEHGEFWQIPSSHLFGHGCPKCAFEKSLNISISQGELEVMNILNKHNIEYKTQVPIESTINNTGWMYVDFYIPSMNTIIEYNGRQHYIPVDLMGGQIHLKQQQARDEELRQYCKDNNIKLIEIRYDEDVWVELEAQLFNENTNNS